MLATEVIQHLGALTILLLLVGVRVEAAVRHLDLLVVEVLQDLPLVTTVQDHLLEITVLDLHREVEEATNKY